jgi:hypothetical protein
MLNLFLHPVSSGRSIADLYKRAFAEAVELYVVSAYLRTWDTELTINSQCGAFAFIVGKDFGITRKQACLDVVQWLPPQRKSCFLIADGISGFHPKALFGKEKGGTCYSIIGSSNLSDAGWNTNYEANTFGKLSAHEFAAVRNWIDGIRRHSVPISKKWLAAYREAPATHIKKPSARDGSLPSLSAIKLPAFRGQSAIIRARRAKRKKFAEIRPKLLSAIRRCASGRISKETFYEILEGTWGSHESRIQGWGWQVTGRDSDFEALCRGLVSILNADAAARDLIVVQVIDELTASNVPTRRALLSELLCLFFPAEYPVSNEPVASYVRPYVKAPYGSTEGAKYLHLALSLRAALRENPQYPAKDLLELDGLIWKFQDRKAQSS